MLLSLLLSFLPFHYISICCVPALAKTTSLANGRTHALSVTLIRLPPASDRPHKRMSFQNQNPVSTSLVSHVNTCSLGDSLTPRYSSRPMQLLASPVHSRCRSCPQHIHAHACSAARSHSLAPGITFGISVFSFIIRPLEPSQRTGADIANTRVMGWARSCATSAGRAGST